MLENWIPEKVPLSKLLPNENNPRTITKAKFEKLIESLQGVGIFKPIICTWDYKIIGGTQRNIAILELMPASFEVYIMRPPRPLSQDEYDKVLLLDNAHSGEWDIDALANNYSIEMIEDAGIDVTIPPVGVIPTEGLTDEDDVPEVKEPIVKKGDLWLLGDHRMLCGDSTFVDTIEMLLLNEKADLLLTDPPYNYGSETSCSKSNTGDNQLRDVEWDKSFDPGVVPFFDYMSENFVAYIFTSPFLFGEIFKIAKIYSDFAGMLCWEKTTYNSNPIKKHPTWNIEPIVYATKGKHVFNYDGSKSKNALLSFAGEHSTRFVGHPSQKPIKMLECILENSSNIRSACLDLFLGSGSTLIACEKTNRRCYGIEIDPHYCTVILNRWRSFTGKEPILESTGQTLKEIEEASA